MHDLRTNPIRDSSIVAHREWLSGFDAGYLEKWNRLLDADRESALCEAGVCQLLRDRRVEVQPFEDLREERRKPDFLCEVNKERFYVETTCVRVPTLSRRTKMSAEPSRETLPFHPAGTCQAIASKCKDKSEHGQFDNLDSPALLAVGTFHWPASAIGFSKVLAPWVLTGEPCRTREVDPESPADSDWHEWTDLEYAAFIAKDGDGELQYIARNVSGILLCGLDSWPATCIGVAHPSPFYDFNWELMPSIEVASVLIDDQQGELHVNWR